MKALSESLLAVAVLSVLFLKIDPFHWFMPTEMQMLLLCVFAAAFALYAGVVFREHAKDERESSHLYRASRWGYLVGVVALSVIIVVQDVLHELDPWFLGVLGAMVVTKLVVLRWSQWKH
jgi:uncharacterized membrane protein YdcZ (DUF606 family)